MGPRRLTPWLLLLLGVMGLSLAFAADKGDPVLYTDTDTIDVPSLKRGGLDVLTVGNTPAYDPVRLATTGNITLSGEQTIDGTLTSTSDVLVWQQTDATQNGIYVTAAGSWARRSDLDAANEFTPSFTVYVQTGLTYGNTIFRFMTTGAVTLGVTDLTFEPERLGLEYLATQLLAQGGTANCTPTHPNWSGAVLPVAGDGAAVSLGNPQVTAGVRTGQQCYLVGTDDTNTIEIGDGTGVQLVQTIQGTTLASRDAMLLVWDGTLWRQSDQLGAPGTGSADAQGLQANCDVDCVLRNLTEALPYMIAPADTTGPKEVVYSVDGNFTREYLLGDDTPAGIPQQTIEVDTCLTIRAVLGDPPSNPIVQQICNVAGTSLTFASQGTYANLPTTGDYAGQPYTVIDCATARCATGGGTAYAIMVAKVWNGSAWVNARQPWHLPWSAAGTVVDGTACAVGTAAAINSGPRVVAITCTDSASGTIELSVDTPDRYLGGAITACFEWNDPVDNDNVIDLAVVAMFRGSGAVVNSTFSSPVEATATLGTAHASAFACATITPNGAAAGVGRLYVKATVDAAGGYNDSGNAKLLGGYIQGD